MIVLDTNVISELMRAEPHPAVLAWITARPRATLYTTSISQAEIIYGIAALPQGRRRAALAAAAEAMFTEDFADRALPFDGAAAAYYAESIAARRQAGNPIEAFDALIAATALASGAGVATRDIAGFQGCGLKTLIDRSCPMPWCNRSYGALLSGWFGRACHAAAVGSMSVTSSPSGAMVSRVM